MGSRDSDASEVPKGQGDVGAACATGDGGLMRTEMWLDGRAGGAGKNCTKESAEAAGKLQGA